LTLLRRQGDLPDDGGQRKQTERIRHLGQQTQRNTSPRLLLKTAVIGGKKKKKKMDQPKGEWWLFPKRKDMSSFIAFVIVPRSNIFLWLNLCYLQCDFPLNYPKVGRFAFWICSCYKTKWNENKKQKEILVNTRRFSITERTRKKIGFLFVIINEIWDCLSRQEGPSRTTSLLTDEVKTLNKTKF
jgi:hypothetical protein